MRILAAVIALAVVVFVQFVFDNYAQNPHAYKHEQEEIHAQKSPQKGAKTEQNLSIYRLLYAKPVAQWVRPNIDESVAAEWQELAPLPEPVFPAHNAYSDVKAYLGLRLFNEPKLSKSGQIACQSCHNAELGFTDGLRVSYGHDRQKGKRNAPNIQMSAFFETLFWDGRAKSLEEQFLGPLTDPVEMANTADNAVSAIQKLENYYPLFVAAFGSGEEVKNWAKHFPELFAEDEKRLRAFLTDTVKIDTAILAKFPSSEIAYAQSLINIDNIAKAVATYQRSFARAKNSRFNMFMKGEYGYLSDLELYGLDVFRNKGQCMNCHYGAILSDNKFHNLGLSFYGRKLQDLGRYELTHSAADVGAFKTPSLVNVAKSAPYMHNGIFPHLRGVINMYNAGFPNAVPKGLENDPLLPKNDSLIRELNLTAEEISALEAFLRTL